MFDFTPVNEVYDGPQPPVIVPVVTPKGRDGYQELELDYTIASERYLALCDEVDALAARHVEAVYRTLRAATSPAEDERNAEMALNLEGLCQLSERRRRMAYEEMIAAEQRFNAVRPVRVRIFTN